ncbi:radical SAM protein [bacterium]|nr:radical SAM protein [bacterium]
MHKPLQTKSALHKLKSNYLPYKYDLNIYRGCKHNCIYCFAQYSHQYLESKDFFNDIYYKENIVEVLEKELSSRNWKGEVINIGGVTDTYQPIEKEMELMPKILKLMIKYENPVSICTKSDLILRDIELIKELSEKTVVNIASSITCKDEKVRKKFEPYSPSTMRRFDMLERIKKETKASTGILMMPIFPYITDSVENLEYIFKKAKELDVEFVLPAILNLKGDTKEKVFSFLQKEYPLLLPKYERMYKGAFVEKVYRDAFYIKIRNIKKKYNFQNKGVKYEPERQLSIFT